MLACRLCRVPMSAPAGCAHCDPVRRNLVVVGEREDDSPSLAGVGNDVVRMIKGRLDDIKDALKKATGKERDRAEARLISFANATAKVIGEVRKLQDDGYKAVEALSFQERAAMFIEWVTSLPPAYRRMLQEQMADFEAKISAPLPEVQPS